MATPKPRRFGTPFGYFRALLHHTDTSLLEEWESLLHPEIRLLPLQRHQAAVALWL